MENKLARQPLAFFKTIILFSRHFKCNVGVLEGGLLEGWWDGEKVENLHWKEEMPKPLNPIEDQLVQSFSQPSLHKIYKSKTTKNFLAAKTLEMLSL